jgi:hypothetical protein
MRRAEAPLAREDVMGIGNASVLLANGTKVRVYDVAGLGRGMDGHGVVVGHHTSPDAGRVYTVLGKVMGDDYESSWYCHATHVEPVLDEAEVRRFDSAHDPVSKPSHYGWHPSGVQCADITGAFSFNLGNVIKYVWRAGRKDGNPVLQDLRKAQWYLEREIGRLEKEGTE